MVTDPAADNRMFSRPVSADIVLPFGIRLNVMAARMKNNFNLIRYHLIEITAGLITNNRPVMFPGGGMKLPEFFVA
jgi:hypothetical protein